MEVITEEVNIQYIRLEIKKIVPKGRRQKLVPMGGN